MRRVEEEKRAQEALRAQQMGVGAMRKLLADMEDRRLGQYVIKLQARWRGRMARKRYAEVKEILRREKAKVRDLKRARHLAEFRERKRLEELRRKERRQHEVSKFEAPTRCGVHTEDPCSEAHSGCLPRSTCKASAAEPQA